MADDWRQRILDELDAKDIRAPRTSTRFDFHRAGHGLVLAAARARGMSVAAYVRRAAIAFAVHDLRADWAEVMADEPRIDTTGGPRDHVRPNGAGYGEWKITGLGMYL